MTRQPCGLSSRWLTSVLLAPSHLPSFTQAPVTSERRTEGLPGLAHSNPGKVPSNHEVVTERSPEPARCPLGSRGRGGSAPLDLRWSLSHDGVPGTEGSIFRGLGEALFSRGACLPGLGWTHGGFPAGVVFWAFVWATWDTL